MVRREARERYKEELCVYTCLALVGCSVPTQGHVVNRVGWTGLYTGTVGVRRGDGEYLRMGE